MKKILKSLSILAVTSLVFLAGPVFSDNHLPLVTGEVKKIKTKSGKITIKHEPIPNLDMPSMTMVFRADEGVDISQFEKGDIVAFTVEEKNGKMYVISIAKSE